MYSKLLSTVLAAGALVAKVQGHGIVTTLAVDGTILNGYDPFNDPYKNPVPARIVWPMPDNGPVTDVSSSAIACNKLSGSKPTLNAPIKAGGQVTFTWTDWPPSHLGPVMTYLAYCGDDCANHDQTTLSFFKINHDGLHSDGSWASNQIINTKQWTVTIPNDILPGKYLLRHEILALHSAGQSGGAQFYPMCANLLITGGGSAQPSGVKFPGAYGASDPGILVNIYYPPLSTYIIPGPTVYTPGAVVSPTGNTAGGTSSSLPGPIATGSSSSAAASTTAAANSKPAAGAWAQCGGQGWTGSTTCVTGYVCTYSNAYYSQCIPGTAPSSTPAQAATTTSTTAAASNTKTANLWDQCGGTGFSGATACGGSAYCSSVNNYYAQCVPTSTAAANTPTTMTTITTKATTTTTSNTVKTTTSTSSTKAGTAPSGFPAFADYITLDRATCQAAAQACMNYWQKCMQNNSGNQSTCENYRTSVCEPNRQKCDAISSRK